VPVRGLRGATTADRNSAEAIVEATGELLAELIRLNEIDPEEVAFAYFTTTPDLDAEFPALAARQLGWIDVPLLCGQELAVRMPNPRGVTRCVRILILYNTGKLQKEMKHVYLRGAKAIKRDLEQHRSHLEGVVR
jgi:chorismate mutase